MRGQLLVDMKAQKAIRVTHDEYLSFIRQNYKGSETQIRNIATMLENEQLPLFVWCIESVIADRII